MEFLPRNLRTVEPVASSRLRDCHVTQFTSSINIILTGNSSKKLAIVITSKIKE